MDRELKSLIYGWGGILFALLVFSLAWNAEMWPAMAISIVEAGVSAYVLITAFIDYRLPLLREDWAALKAMITHQGDVD